MISVLARIFIKDCKNYKNADVRYKYGLLCGGFGIFLNVVLFAAKYFAGVISNSIAITADSFNNLSDAGSSLITLIGFRLAKSKPDPEHPFGHGRIEDISGLIVSFVIILMGFELGKSSVYKIIHPEEIESGLLPGLILIVSIAVKFYMSFYNRRIAEKIDSSAMKATATDSLSDCISTFAVLLCMIISHFTELNIDGICGTLVALFIILAGIGAVKETIGPLLGQKPDRELVSEIEKIVMSNEYVVGTHDMVVHDYGPGRLMISLHAEVDGSGDIYAIHDAIDTIENEINERFCCETVIHMDPIAVDNEAVGKMKSKLYELLKAYDEQLKIHDFRMVEGPTHTNIIFDAVVGHKTKKTDSEIKSEIEELVKKNFENTFAVVKIDRDYV